MSDPKTDGGPTIAIAGTGVAGLACAAALAGRAVSVLFDRLPVAGGEHWEEPAVRRLASAADAAGSRWRLGTQLIRWDGSAALAVGQTPGVVRADALVVATGHRPLTRAELGIAGPRCGGILPVTVALHLLRNGVRLGERPLVIGDGSWALAAVRALVASGSTHVTVVLPERQPLDLPRDERVDVVQAARVAGVTGDLRITAAEVSRPGRESMSVMCDALVLAAGRVPYRNIDGAFDEELGAVFAQPGGPASEKAVELAGRRAAEHALSAASEGRPPRQPALRIGAPA